jgi:predicted nucleic acid-binding protein
VNAFFDTSVLVAASVASHEHHAGAHAVMERVVSNKDRGYVASHSLAELYSVLTRLPVSPRIQPSEAARIIAENISRHFIAVALDPTDYETFLASAAKAGTAGGAIYDALILACSEKVEIDRFYTFNVADFRRLAPGLVAKIAAP